MEPKIITDVLNVALALKKCKLEHRRLANVDAEFGRLQTYFKCNRMQIVFLVILFEMDGKDREMRKVDYARHLDCNPIVMMPFEADFNELVENDFIVQNDKFIAFRPKRDAPYFINPIIKASIVANESFKIEPQEEIDNAMDIILHLSEMIEERENEKESIDRLWHIMERYIVSRFDNDFCTVLYNLNLEGENAIALIYLMANNIESCSGASLQHLVSKIFDSKSERRNFEQSIESKENELIREHWIENKNASFFSNSEIVLTQKTADFFEPYGVKFRLYEKVSKINLVKPDTIHKKNLYFNTEEHASIVSLEKSLKFRKHNQIKKALQKEGMRTGICTLYYGAPGTGKTESVYQIAKATGRSVWKVDMSELKSMWFGESQKLVNGLFNDYKELCADEKRTPILLLNEADAILGKRNPNASSSTDKASNAIQNIFLDSLEDFEGILFATTNLETSLDTAFERRFLFKLKFERPHADTRALIWKSKVRGLKTEQANALANKFDLSGGEIENVVRKLKMDKVLNGFSNTYEKLIRFCKQERLSKKSKNLIGFNR